MLAKARVTEERTDEITLIIPKIQGLRVEKERKSEQKSTILIKRKHVIEE